VKCLLMRGRSRRNARGVWLADVWSVPSQREWIANGLSGDCDYSWPVYEDGFEVRASAWIPVLVSPSDAISSGLPRIWVPLADCPRDDSDMRSFRIWLPKDPVRSDAKRYAGLKGYDAAMADIGMAFGGWQSLPAEMFATDRQRQAARWIEGDQRISFHGTTLGELSAWIGAHLGKRQGA
jgi:hypothetical protein